VDKEDLSEASSAYFIASDLVSGKITTGKQGVPRTISKLNYSENDYKLLVLKSNRQRR